MPKFYVPFTIDGEVEIEAATAEEAKAKVDYGMSIREVIEWQDDYATYPAEPVAKRDNIVRFVTPASGRQ